MCGSATHMTALLQPPLYINDRTEEPFAGSVYPQREAAVTPRCDSEHSGARCYYK